MKKISLLILLLLSQNTGAKKIDFMDALRTILLRDTYLPVQSAYIDSTSIARYSKGFSFLPTVDIGKRKTEHLRSNLKNDTLFLSSNLNIFKGGSDLFAFQSKTHELNQYRHGLKRLELDREKHAITQLVNLILQEKKSYILQKMLDIKTSSLELAKKRFRRGFSPQDDILKAKVELKNSMASYKDSLISVTDAKKIVKELLGESEIRPIWPLKADLLKINKNSLKSSQMLDHPTILEAQSKLFSEDKLAKYYRGLMLPKIDFNYSWNQNNSYGQRSVDQIGVISITFPLFDGLSRFSNYKTQSVQKISAEYSLLRAKRDISEELVAAKKNLLSSIETVIERDETVKLSRKLYKNNSNRFRQGKISLTDLEWEQNRLLRSENLANDGKAKAHLAYARYCHAIGKPIFDCK